MCSYRDKIKRAKSHIICICAEVTLIKLLLMNALTMWLKYQIMNIIKLIIILLLKSVTFDAVSE